MDKSQILAAKIALAFVTVILGSAFVAIVFQAGPVRDLLTLTELVLSWPVAAGGLVFGGAQSILFAWKK